MAGANKHKQRSKRSHFNGIPRYMFAIRAAEKKNIKENQKQIKAFAETINKGKDNGTEAV